MIEGILSVLLMAGIIFAIKLVGSGIELLIKKIRRNRETIDEDDKNQSSTTDDEQTKQEQ